MPTRFVVSLARLYNTSTDYILGMTDEIKPKGSVQFTPSLIFYLLLMSEGFMFIVT